MGCNPDKDDGAMFAFLGLVLVPCFLAVIWISVAFNAKYRNCVHLENGLNLGCEAVFDLSNSYLWPIAVPRYKDGTPLLRDQTWSTKITDTTIYSLALGAIPHRYYFVWRADTRLIYETADPKIYQDLVAKAGPANWDFKVNAIDTASLLNKFIKNPNFKVEKCPTALFTY
jgi:hypothetical protein